MWRVAFIASLILLAQTAWGVQPEAILGAEDSAEEIVTQPGSPAPEVIAEKPTESDLPEVSLTAAKKEKPITFVLRPGYSSRTYKLSSQVVNGNFPGGTGFEGELMIARETVADQRMVGSFQYSTHTFTGIPNLAPASFTLQSWNGYLEYQWIISGVVSDTKPAWWFGAGYQVKKRGGASALPFTPMTDVLYQGPRLGFTYEGPRVFGRVGLNLSTHIMIPVFFRENIDTTGSYRFGLTSESALFVTYALRDALMVGIGAKFSFDYRGYSGVGTRSTANATEMETVFSIPLELRLRF